MHRGVRAVPDRDGLNNMADEYITEYFGIYRLVRSIGRGSMGEVYLAINATTQRKVAIKQMLPHLAQDYEYRARFERECKVVSTMKSPYLIPIHTFGQLGGTLFIDMEYVDGADLGALIAQNGEIPPERAVPIMVKLARCLEEARRRGVIHRDVKPSNILVASEADHPYLLDFGLAKATGVHEAALSSIGRAIGTPAYMAPEALRGQADHRSDIYSLACVFHECISGRKPYPAASPAAMEYSHLHDDIPKPSDRRSEFEPFDDIIQQGLAKDADSRFQTSLEFSGALIAAMQQYAKNQGINFDISPLVALQHENSDLRKRRTFLKVAAFTLPIATGGWAAWTMSSSEPVRGNDRGLTLDPPSPSMTERMTPDKQFITSIEVVDDSNAYISAIKPGIGGQLTEGGILLSLDIGSGYLRTITTYAGNAVNIALRAGGKAVYVAGETVNTVGAVDRTNGSMLASATVPEPSVICVSPDGTQVFVSGRSPRGGPAVYALNVPKLDSAIVIDTPGSALLDLIASPDQGTLYAATNQQGNANIWVIELGRQAVVNGIALNENYPWGVEISPDGSRLYVAGDGLLVIDAIEKTVIQKFPLNESLYAGVAISWNRNVAYMAGAKVVEVNLANGRMKELAVPAPSEKGYTSIALTLDESKLILSNEDKLRTIRL